MRSKRVSLGFRVVDYRTGEAFSETFKTRAKARAALEALYLAAPCPGCGASAAEPCRGTGGKFHEERGHLGIQHVEDYVAA